MKRIGIEREREREREGSGLFVFMNLQGGRLPLNQNSVLMEEREEGKETRDVSDFWMIGSILQN